MLFQRRLTEGAGGDPLPAVKHPPSLQARLRRSGPVLALFFGAGLVAEVIGSSNVPTIALLNPLVIVFLGLSYGPAPMLPRLSAHRRCVSPRKAEPRPRFRSRTSRRAAHHRDPRRACAAPAAPPVPSHFGTCALAASDRDGRLSGRGPLLHLFLCRDA